MRLRGLLLLPSLALGIARAEPPANAIADQIRSQKTKVIACYEQALARDPDLFGTLSILFDLAPDGAVKSADLDGGDIDDPAMRACLVAVARTMHFAAGGARYSYPFHFQPDRAGAVTVDAPPFRIQLPRGARDLSPRVPSEKLSDLPKNLLRFRANPRLVAMALRSDAATGDFAVFQALLQPAIPPGGLERIVGNAEQGAATAEQRHQLEFDRAANAKVLEKGLTTVGGLRAARLLSESAVAGFPVALRSLTYYVPARDRTLVLVLMAPEKSFARYRRNFEGAVAALALTDEK